jgi:hypothetical protein
LFKISFSIYHHLVVGRNIDRYRCGAWQSHGTAGIRPVLRCFVDFSPRPPLVTM